MLDVRQVLAQKEQDLERVRREIHALLQVIPLLEERPASPPPAAELPKKEVSSPSPPEQTAERGMAELELYYPFVGRSAERR
ncbi:MAG TPA: hypothetical protein VK466_14405 [Terriglobales bacterium]|nr:hypothetical protein [Terriglobales bacterium]